MITNTTTTRRMIPRVTSTQRGMGAVALRARAGVPSTSGRGNTLLLIEHFSFLYSRILADSCLTHGDVSSDDAGSWEGRETWRLDLFRFHDGEPGLREQGHEILEAAASSVNVRRSAHAVCVMREVSQDQSPTWFEG